MYIVEAEIYIPKIFCSGLILLIQSMDLMFVSIVNGRNIYPFFVKVLFWSIGLCMLSWACFFNSLFIVRLHNFLYIVATIIQQWRADFFQCMFWPIQIWRNTPWEQFRENLNFTVPLEMIISWKQHGCSWAVLYVMSMHCTCTIILWKLNFCSITAWSGMFHGWQYQQYTILDVVICSIEAVQLEMIMHCTCTISLWMTTWNISRTLAIYQTVCSTL